MKTKNYLLLTCLFWIFIYIHAHAQKIPFQSKALFSEQTFQNITAGPDAYFEATKDLDWQAGYKPYMRWRINQEMRLNGKGQIINGQQLIYQEYKNILKREKEFPQRNFSGAWEELGPYSYLPGGYPNEGMGRVNCIALHPNNPNIIFVGAAAGGLWKSVDDGVNWQPLTDGLPSIGISDILIHPITPNLIWIVTGDGDGLDSYSMGVMFSNDGGATWQKRSPDFDLSTKVGPYQMEMHPNLHLTQFMGASNGLYKTTDGWDTSEKVLNAPHVYGVKYKPNNLNVVYAATKNGLYVSNDEGETWVFNNGNGVLPVDTTFSRIAMDVSPDRPNDIYLFYGGGETGFPGFFRSFNGGSTFSMLVDTPNICSRWIPFHDSVHQASYDLALAVDPNDASNIFAGGINLFKSVNGGNVFSLNAYLAQGHAVYPYVHPDIHDVEIGNNAIYVASDGGLYKSSDGGNSYTDLSAGLRISQYYYIDVTPNQIMGGMQDNGTNTIDYSQNNAALKIQGGDGFACAYDTSEFPDIFFSTQAHRYKISNGGNVENITESLNLGDSWNQDFIIDASLTRLIFSCNVDVYRNFFSGLEDWWYNMNAFDELEPGRITALIQGINNSNYLYAAKGNILKRSTTALALNGDVSWTDLTDQVPDSIVITDMAVDPDNAARLFAVCGGFDPNNKVWLKNGHNGAWQNLTGSLPNVPIYSIVYQEGTNDGIYIGTEIGVFYRDNDLGDWKYFSNYLPTVRVYDMKILKGEPLDQLFVGTHGRGIWYTYLVSNGCMLGANLTDETYPGDSEFNGIEVYEVSNTIFSSRKIRGGFGTNVLYSGGVFVQLNPGFEVKRNNIFTANLDGCTGTTVPSFNAPSNTSNK